MDKKKIAGIGVACFLIGGVVTYSGTQLIETNTENNSITENSTENKAVASTKIDKAFDIISEMYYEDIDSDELTEGAISGMLATLDDPYSTYMDKQTANEFTQSLDSSFEGIGAEVGTQDDSIVIISPIKDSPAEKAGLKPNDVIVKIDGETTEGLSLNEAVLKIRGEKGTEVKLEIQRPGERENITFTIKRDTIPRITVYSDVYEENNKQIGYIQITSFSEETAAEFEEELKKLEAKKIDGLVLDVRGNPGGYLLAVEDILDLLVTNEKPYVQIEDKSGNRETVKSRNTEKKDYPIAVLTNDGSASASEILAAALKEVEGYATVGVKTFGKGTVQTAIEMGDGSNIKLTISKWLTPDGNWIHEKGIAPTYEVKQPDYFYVSPITTEETLEFDDNNEQVKRAQVMLKSIGYTPGRTDGYFSEETVTAVKAFQSANKLTATGKLDEETITKIHTVITEKIGDEENDEQLKAAVKIVSQE